MSVKKLTLLRSVKFKLCVPLFVLVAAVVGIDLFSRSSMLDLSAKTTAIAGIEMPAIATLFEVSSAVNAAYLAERANLSMKVDSEKYQSVVDAHGDGLEVAAAGLKALSELPVAQDNLDKIAVAITVFEAWRVTSAEVFELRGKDNRMNRLLATDLSNGRSRQEFDALIEHISDISESWILVTQGVVDTMIDATDTDIDILTAIAVVSALFGLTIATVMPRATIKRLDDINARILDIAEGDGDLRRRIATNHGDEIDNIAESFNTFCDNLHDTIWLTKHSALAVSDSIQSIAEDNRSLSAQTDRQAIAIRDASEGLTQVAQSMSVSAENAQRAGNKAASTSNEAADGSSIIENTILAMQDISESSGEIGSITGIVDTIAFQTNLLALNAAVEAARAGEQGKGFAVVASEVRQLAQRSSTAASDIRSLSDKTSERVGLGTELVNNSGDTLRKIVDSIHDVSETVNDISRAAAEQNQGLQTISHTFEDMTQLMQSTSRFVSGVADTSKDLEVQAQTLMDTIARFKLNDKPASGTQLKLRTPVALLEHKNKAA